MKRTAGLVAGSVALSLAATAVVTVIQRFRAQRQMVTQEVSSLLSGRTITPSHVVSNADLATLPEPVQRWLRYSGVVGKPIPSVVRLKQQGGIRLSRSARYMPFTARQYYTIDPPGFIWSADVSALPGVVITGRDKYANGTGKMDIRLFATVPVVDAAGPELDQGTMLRYLNEMMWFPAAALGPSISWQPFDADLAIATLKHCGKQVSATFTFDAEGKLVTMEADRFRQVENSFRLERWSTPIRAYGEFNGIRVPVEGEGVWVLPEGPFSYIRLQITDLQYDCATEY